MTSIFPTPILNEKVKENPMRAIRHVQNRIQISSGVSMIFGAGPLFRHVDPDQFMWNGEGERISEVFIPFKTVIERPPIVFISLTSIDASQAQNLRLKLSTRDATKQGFIASARTWSDTKLASIEASWFAVTQSVEARVSQLTPRAEREGL